MCKKKQRLQFYNFWLQIGCPAAQVEAKCLHLTGLLTTSPFSSRTLSPQSETAHFLCRHSRRRGNTILKIQQKTANLSSHLCHRSSSLSLLCWLFMHCPRSVCCSEYKLWRDVTVAQKCAQRLRFSIIVGAFTQQIDKGRQKGRCMSAGFSK